MAMITIQTGAVVLKDPSDVKVYKVDWDSSNLAPGVTITNSSWTITAIKPSTTDTVLTKDNEAILSGDRTTQVRLAAGTLNQVYEVANKVTTNESPAQTKERSFRVLIQNL